MEPSPPSSLPTLDGKYQLLRKLGEGGMGAVYEGRHRGTGRRVAVKVIAGEAVKKSAEVVSRFQREAMASGSLESQYIAQVLDTGVDATSGSPYLVMELLTGEDVEKLIERLGPLPPDIALRIIAQACLGLQKAHEAQVVHRDIKPANLFLAKREGSEIMIKLLDFGIAKAKTDEQLAGSAGHSMTRTGMMLGSPLYMSPEQAMGRKSINHRTDIWSLGVVLYEALCGQTPHGHSQTVGELVIRICGEAPQLLQERAPWVPPEVAAIAHKALALDPAARFASAAEMFAAVRARLPQGHALDESMLVPLSQQARAVAAPRWSLTSDIRAQSPSFPELSQSNPDMALLAQAKITAASLAQQTGALAGQKSTTAGFGQSGDKPPSRSRAVPIAVAGVLALGVAGAAFFARHASHPPTPPPASNLASAAPAAPPTVSVLAQEPAVSATPSRAASATPPADIGLPATPAATAPASKPAPSRAQHPAPSAAHAAPSPTATTSPAATTPPPSANAKYNPLDHL